MKDIRYLFHRIFQRLWAESPASRQSVMDFSARRGGPVYPAMAWNGQWDRLSADEHLARRRLDGPGDEARERRLA